MEQIFYPNQFQFIKCTKKICESQAYISELHTCELYHNEYDHRRECVLEENNQFSYSNMYFGENFHKDYPHCKNVFQYLYHPVNYQRQQCIEKDKCHFYSNQMQCPNYHNLIEKEKAKAQMIEYYQFKIEKKKDARSYQFSDENYQRYDQEQYDEEDDQEDNSEDNSDENLDKTLIERDLNLSDEQEDYMPQKESIQSKYATPIKIDISREFSNWSQQSEGFKNFESQIFIDKRQQNNTNYVKGKLVQFNNPQMQQYRVGDTELQPLASHICAFLNTRQGGTIYIGITENCIIKGETINRSQRDKIQLELDNLLRLFTPTILARECQMKFVPIFSDDTKSTYQRNKFIIQIDVQRSKQVSIYFCPNKTVYYRQNNRTQYLNHNEIYDQLKERLISSFLKSNKDDYNLCLEGSDEKIQQFIGGKKDEDLEIIQNQLDEVLNQIKIIKAKNQTHLNEFEQY